MKLSIVVILLFIAQLKCLGQSLVGSSGGDFATAVAQVSYSIGEVFISNYDQFNEGFQQVDITTITSSNEEIFKEITIYPNPVENFINISIPQNFGQYELRIYDTKGVELYYLSSQKQIINIDLELYFSGTYFLILSRNDQINSYKIIKK